MMYDGWLIFSLHDSFIHLLHELIPYVDYRPRQITYVAPLKRQVKYSQVSSK